jgi:isoquinoline 1-oxidoreductase alpha subunit
MAIYNFKINGKKQEVNARPGTPLLWILRETLGLTGTKYGCGIAQCGSCTIHLDGTPMRACVLPVDGVTEDQEITTIEGLSETADHPLQKAWVKAQVPQCGYCHSGQIMQAAALLKENPSPSKSEIKSHMNGILCRCGTYMRIVKAIELASGKEELDSAISLTD